MLGYSESEMNKLQISDWDRSLSKSEVTSLIQSITETPMSFETIHTRKDKSTYTAAITTVKINYNNEQVIYTSVRDISLQKRNEQTIFDQKKELETIFQYAQDGIAIINYEGDFKKVNHSFAKITGYTERELQELNCKSLSTLEEKEIYQNVISEAVNGKGIENFEISCNVANNKRIIVNMSISRLPNYKSLLLIVKDTSALKMLEEQSKLASMGEMIGNIAHQWRQPLSIISTSASGMKANMDFGIELTKNDVLKFSNIITQQSEYLSQTIDNFRNFLKGDKNHVNIFVYKVLENTLSLTNATIKNNYIQIIKDIDHDILIHGSINELTEAFINIINNAKDVLKEKIDKNQNRLIFITAKRNQDNKVEIIFKDNGGGISDDIIKKIFEPYFTSKHQSIGTGLGLTMANKIINERHKGSIFVYNDEYIYKNKRYKGACFKVCFDLIE